MIGAEYIVIMLPSGRTGNVLKPVARKGAYCVNSLVPLSGYRVRPSLSSPQVHPAL